jgi:drug/metabolite transporter (DMT)-like permease
MDFNAYRGELAALVTAFSWTVGALAFTAAAKRLGSLPLNIIRLAIAWLMFVILESALRGLPLPTDAAAHNWLWLGLSGLVGFTIGDLCLFQAFILIGARLTMLVTALVPMMAAVMSWLALGEGLSALAIAGMALTTAGVAWVVLEERPAPPPHLGRNAASVGFLLALGASVCQAAGMVLSKQGLEDYDAFAGTQIRVTTGLVGFIVLVIVLRAWPRLKAGLAHRSGMGYATMGAFFGPFIGVGMSLVAVKYAPVGVAATIMAIVPVLIIPFVIVLYRERISPRAILGAVLAVAGVALLFV